MTHGTVVGIALQSTIATAAEAAVHSSVRGKVTLSATLKNNQKEARAYAPIKSEGENAARHRRRSWGENGNKRTHIRPDFQLSGTEN